MSGCSMKVMKVILVQCDASDEDVAQECASQGVSQAMPQGTSKGVSQNVSHRESQSECESQVCHIYKVCHLKCFTSTK